MVLWNSRVIVVWFFLLTCSWYYIQICYRPPEKVMFSESRVSHSIHREPPADREHLLTENPLLTEISLLTETPSWQRPSQLLTSSGGHCTGRYVSYWNTFLFSLYFVRWHHTIWIYKTSLISLSFRVQQRNNLIEYLKTKNALKMCRSLYVKRHWSAALFCCA